MIDLFRQALELQSILEREGLPHYFVGGLGRSDLGTTPALATTREYADIDSSIEKLSEINAKFYRR